MCFEEKKRRKKGVPVADSTGRWRDLIAALCKNIGTKHRAAGPGP
jgi:cell wall-associated NlpC family hydrolase